MAASVLTSSEETKGTTEMAKTTTKKTAPKTVTVCMNFPRSITFEVIDNSGILHKVTINGNATHLRGLPKGILPTGGAYGLTPGVDADLWEAIKAKYHDMPHFRNGLIFAHNSAASVRDAVAEHKDVRNGYEPIDVTKTRTRAADTKAD